VWVCVCGGGVELVLGRRIMVGNNTPCVRAFVCSFVHPSLLSLSLSSLLLFDNNHAIPILPTTIYTLFLFCVFVVLFCFISFLSFFVVFFFFLPRGGGPR
jgi:hypothetical protein